MGDKSLLPRQRKSYGAGRAVSPAAGRLSSLWGRGIAGRRRIAGPKGIAPEKARFLIPMGIAAAAVIALCFWLGHTPPEVAIDSPGAAQSTYIALTALENDRDLSTEEIYQYRAAIYANIPFLDWVAFGKLGEAGKETETQQMLLSWLAKQENLSETEIACLLAGACRTNLDGWMADGYCAVLG